MCDLGLTLDAHWIQESIERLGHDLARRGIRFRPHVWLSSEWFSPSGVPGIAIPFYLAHPRLMRLERNLMLEVEGGSRRDFQRILRHECGHAIQSAYRLNRRKRWHELFGKSSKKYPDVYRPDPASRQFVQHLPMYYAQSHPDEDFAETFAVWLGSRHAWRRRYEGWPALHKLEYMDEIMGEVRATAAPVRTRRKVDPASRIKTTLREHYALRMEQGQFGAPDIYDQDLRKLFVAERVEGAEPAGRFLRRNRTLIRQLISRWTGQYQFTLDHVLEDMIRRCRELRLYASGDEADLRMQFAVLLTVQTMHSLFNRRDWISM
jgi:hypothetical protein